MVKLETKKLQTGIFTAEVTLYKTGNVHIKLTNQITKRMDVFQTRKKTRKKGYIK